MSLVSLNHVFGSQPMLAFKADFFFIDVVELIIYQFHQPRNRGLQGCYFRVKLFKVKMSNCC